MMKKAILYLIRIYQKTISPDHGSFQSDHRGCRFYPSCSEYTHEAINKFGVVRGIWFGFKRILKCHPWSEGGVDKVPTK